MVQRIRHSAKLVVSLPPDIQRAARESYAVSLRAVFYSAAACTFVAFLSRLPVRLTPYPLLPPPMHYFLDA